MKLILTLIALFGLTVANAQRTGAVFFPAQNQNISSSGLRDVTDTIIPVSFIPANEGGLGCFTGIYTSPDSGFVTGNNQYGDLEKAQFYDLARMGYANSGAVQSVVMKVNYKTENASPENVVAKIYSTDSTGVPVNLLGTSAGVNLSSVNASGGYTQFIFDTPVQVSDSFFVSIQLPSSSGDTLVILSTQDNCVGNSGWAWEQWKNGTWHSIKNSWLFDVDLAIFPVVDLPFGNFVANIDAVEDPRIFPNPANDFLTLSFSAFSNELMHVSILNSEGKIITQNEMLMNSSMKVQLDCSGLPDGLYQIVLSDSKHRWNTSASIFH